MEGTGFPDDVSSVELGAVDIRRLQVGVQSRKANPSQWALIRYMGSKKSSAVVTCINRYNL